jgi:ubiquinone/menaquinone biosynthesis C-methylase UbiE
MAGQPQWQQVSGNAAEVYGRHLVPAMFASWAPLLIEDADLRSGEQVLDVACGTGVLTRLAAERVGKTGRVVGLDLNAGMLSVARSSSPFTGAAIEWCEASALAMPLPSASFDVVLCQQGLQQCPDRPTAVAEMHRVLHTSGRMVASVWGKLERSPGMAALVEALEKHVSVAAANNRRAPFALSDAAELNSLIVHVGFRDVSVKTLVGTARFPSIAKFVEYQLAATPLSTLGGISDDTFDAVIYDVSTVLRAYVTDGSLTFPMEAHVVTARKRV